MHPVTNASVEFRILGPLEVRDGAGVTPLPRRRERALLAALLLRPGEVVSTDRLVEAVWGEEPPRTVVGSLQNAVSELRKALGADLVVTRAPGYVLVVDPETIDAVRFERAVQRAAGLPASERAEALAGALALWRGPALADLADEAFARTEAARLDELRLAATEERLDADLELGRGADLVAEIDAHVAANPLRERLRGQLMLALYRSGRQADALEAYQDARRALVDGLGIDPSPALQELERRILRQDPELLATAASQTAVAAVVGAVPTRKTITVLAAALDDVSELDPEPLRARVERFLSAVGEAAARHGGALDRFLGSEAVAVFGIPAAHEDDALRAARAAVELREALLTEGDAVRVGIATGEALVGTADTPVVGDVVAVAASLRDAAEPGAILAAEATHSLVRDAVVAGEPVSVGPRQIAARPLEAVQGARGRARRLDTPFVGREPELAALREALGRATADGRCVAVTVLGDAGIGKTRLAEVLATTLVRGRVLVTQCVPYGEGSTFLPVTDLVYRAAGAVTEEALAGLLPADDEGRLAARQLAALGDPGATVPRGEAFWAVRMLLESLARDDPLVVVLDDVHWAEPALLDLVEYLVERVSAPVVLLCLARPELLDARPGWAGAMSAVTVVPLGPLGQDQARTLLESLVEDVDERVRRRIVERAEGNALHLEQLVAFIADEGGDPGLESVPPTIEAVLASRMDGLSPDVRDTLQRAAVAGREATRGIVVALSEPGAPVDAALLELTRRSLLHPEPADGHDDAYRFHHALLRDVAYGQLPKAVRAVLHERAAAWLDRDGPGPDELVGWHLEQAHRYRSELRPEDPELPRLAAAAGERLGAAGIRAARASDPATIPLLQRASALLPDGPVLADLLLELGPWLRTTSEPAASRRAFEEAIRIAQATGDFPREARARIDLAWAASAMDTQRPISELGDLIDQLLPILEAAQDSRGLQRAWQFLASVRVYEEQLAAAADAAREAALHARAAGWWPPRQPVLMLGIALVHGPTPVPTALTEIEALLAEHGADRSTWAAAATAAASLYSMTDDQITATDLMATAHAIFVGLDDRLAIRTLWTPQRLVQLRLAGEADSARKLVSSWISDLRREKNDAFLSTALAQLADLVADGQVDQTRELVAEAQRRASSGDVFVQAIMRSVSARLEAATGDYESAKDGAAESMALLEKTDALSDRARIAIGAARVHELCGDRDRASTLLDEARAHYRLKGNIAALASLERHGVEALT